MPAKVKVRILAGRNLPVMDKSSDASDAFVEVKLGNTTYKTEVYRRSLNPFWNSEWFRFEVSDQELQDEPLQIRIMDYDTYSANDAIGKVYINLNPLLLNPGRSMNGWLPIYDTLHGIRGEINCMVKVNLFADNNQFRNSSCGVRFFFSDIPNGYKCDAILGFVDELLVNDDPEYQWIDKIRTPRASNEARQTLFTKLSGEVQRKLGMKAEVFGGNAVIGYQQSLDLEGGSGIVGRGIGTAVVLSKIGYKYEGVISPLVLCNPNMPYPYYASSNERAIDRLTSQFSSFHGTAAHAPERQLVHSVSADYFYEAPSRPYHKKLSSAREGLPYSVTRNAFQNEQSDTSYLDTFVGRHSDGDETDIDYDDDDDDDNEPSLRDKSNNSPTQRSTASSSRFPGFIKTPLKSENSAQKQLRLIKRKSSNSLLSKLLPKNETIVQKLAEITRPAPQTVTLKLIRKLSNHRNRAPSSNSQVDDQHNRPHHQSMKHKSTRDDSNTTPGSRHQQFSYTTTSCIPISQSSESTSVIPSIVHAASKRKSDKSQATLSNDDALSIIEEKLDDDDNILRPAGQQTRTRLLSTSSNRSNRKITRSKEIDLSGDNESMALPLETISPKRGATTSHTSSGDDEDVDGSNVVSDTVLSSTLEPKTIQTAPPESVSSTSSPSVSVLTDDTIKVKSTQAEFQSPKLSTQLSTPNPEVNQSLRRSDTELAQSQSQSLDNQALGERNKLVSPTDKRQQNSKQQQSRDANSSNFIQSVRAIKAQQHLLQNLIKRQNQNLVTSSMSKAKNAFTYPSRIYQSEYPFVTLMRYPEDLIQCTGGVVSAHSVKLLDHIINDEESETRDIWWTEIRKEIRSHAKALNCNTILGYSETSRVLGDVCILSARGTAAVMRPSGRPINSSPPPTGPHQQALKVPHTSASPLPPSHSSMPPRTETTSSKGELKTTNSTIPDVDMNTNDTQFRNRASSKSSVGGTTPSMSALIDCSFCHTPLICVESITSLANCTICNSSKVPDVLLLTIDAPKSLNIVSTSTLVQARVCRIKRDSHGESSAKEIGDALPFLEYELHRQLFSKLKFKSLNCLFNLCIDISIGETMITGVATGTGCFVLGLPTPEMPHISAGKGIKAAKLDEIQRLLSLGAIKNRESLGLDQIELQLDRYRQQLQTLNYQSASSAPPESVASIKDLRRQSFDASPSGPSQSGVAAVVDQTGFTTAYTSGGDLSDDNNMPTDNLTLANSSQHPSNKSMIESQSDRRYLRNFGSQRHHHKHHHHHHHHHHSHHKHHHHHNSNQHHHHHHHNKSSYLGSRSSAQPAENLINLVGDDNNIVLEVDDNEDADIIALLIDSDIPDGYLVCNSETAPSINQCSITSINMFTQVIRVKLSGLDQFAQQFDRILQALMVKQRRSLPCCLAKLLFVVDLPEAHVVQITVTGSVLGLSSPVDGDEQSNQSADSGGGEYAEASGGAQAMAVSHHRTTSASGQKGTSSCTKNNNTNKKTNNDNKQKQQQLGSRKGKAPNSTSTSLSPSSPSSNNYNAENIGSNTTLSSSSESSESGNRSTSSDSTSSTTTSSSSTNSKSSGSRPRHSGGLGRSSSKEGVAAANDQNVESGSKLPSINDDNNNNNQTSELAQPTSGTKVKSSGGGQSSSLTKQLSKGNLAALISAGKSTFNDIKSKSSSSKLVDKIELKESLQPQVPTTRDTIAAVQQELLDIDNDNGNPTATVTCLKMASKRPARSLRAVFKKQQTYPGATSPSISGQDNLLAELSSAIAANAKMGPPPPPSSQVSTHGMSTTNDTTNGKSGASSVAKNRATQLLNKVKQPLKDLGSNFNTSSSTSMVNTGTISPVSHDSARGQQQQQQQLQHKQQSLNVDHYHHQTEPSASKPARHMRVSRSQTSTTTTTQQPGSSTSSFSLQADTRLRSPKGELSNSKLIKTSSPLTGGGGNLNSNIDITSLSYIPNAKEYHYLGNLTFSFVRETNSVRENGGLNGFIHCFLMEVYAIVRAHVSALGGNAFLSFRLQQSCIFYHSNKNQAQCLISVAGDAVQVIL